MFFVIKDGYIFSCMVEKSHVPSEHKNFIFSESEVMEFDTSMMIDIFNINDLDGRKLKSSTKPEVVRVFLRELLTSFKLPERRNIMAKKEAPDSATEAPAKGPSKKEAVIIVKVDSNPKRAGSKAHERFEFYQTGQTVAEFLEAGGTMADVNYDVTKGFIELTEAA